LIILAGSLEQKIRNEKIMDRKKERRESFGESTNRQRKEKSLLLILTWNLMAGREKKEVFCRL